MWFEQMVPIDSCLKAWPMGREARRCSLVGESAPLWGWALRCRLSSTQCASHPSPACCSSVELSAPSPASCLPDAAMLIMN